VLLFVFLWAKGLNANEIRSESEMRPAYGDKCFTRPAIHVWCTKFARGRESIVDKERTGRNVVTATDATIAAVDASVRSDRRVSISDIVRHTGISRDSVHRIVRNHFKFRKVSARWVPKQLKPEQQVMPMMTSLDNLQCYKTEGEAMLLERIVTGDETWVHQYQPKTKQASRQWKHKESPTPTKFKVVPLASKMMATVF